MPTETRVLRTYDPDACTIETLGFPHPSSIRRASFPEACSETALSALSLYTAAPLLDTVGQTVYADAALTVYPTDGFYKLSTGAVAAIGGAFGNFDGFLTCP